MPFNIDGAEDAIINTRAPRRAAEPAPVYVPPSPLLAAQIDRDLASGFTAEATAAAAAYHAAIANPDHPNVSGAADYEDREIVPGGKGIAEASVANRAQQILIQGGVTHDAPAVAQSPAPKPLFLTPIRKPVVIAPVQQSNNTQLLTALSIATAFLLITG